MSGSWLANLVPDNRPDVQRILASERPVTPLDVRLEADRSPSITSTISDATVIPWQTPPSPSRSPERSVETIRPETYKHAIGANEAAYASNTPLVVRFDEDQIRSDEAEASGKARRMVELDLASPPTPVDDTPYIRFAIDQLTRDEEIRGAQKPRSEASSDSYPVE